MEARAKKRFLRMPARKIRLVMDQIRGKRVDEALQILQFVPKAAALPLAELIKSAAANASFNHKMNKDDLVVAEAFADSGPTLKRFQPRAMGRSAMIRKRMSHVTIVVADAGKGN
jgi:large subunit ribosomal protein L22